MDKPVIENRALFADALNGLRATPKFLASKWFYDATGSALFEQITTLPEYYPTRTEIAILEQNVASIAKLVPKGAVLVELGSGASVKTRILLDRLPHLSAYVPLDISARFLIETVERLAKDYPGLNIEPVVADFMADIDLPGSLNTTPKVVFFPGSTIGNLTPPDAVELLKRIRAIPNVAGLILGADLVKDRNTLVHAYDDSAGVTAAFNLNLLTRLNREIGAQFDLNDFSHRAVWNDAASRIEMHLVSQRAHEVVLGTEIIRFRKGETIHTENSHKYSNPALQSLAERSGWRISELLTDSGNQFAVALLQPRT